MEKLHTGVKGESEVKRAGLQQGTLWGAGTEHLLFLKVTLPGKKKEPQSLGGASYASISVTPIVQEAKAT